MYNVYKIDFFFVFIMLYTFGIDINDIINKHLDIESIILLRKSYKNDYKILDNHNYTRIIDIYKKNIIDKRDKYKLELKINLEHLLHLEDILEEIYKYKIVNININSCQIIGTNPLFTHIDLLNNNLLKLFNYYKCNILTVKFNYLYLIEHKLIEHKRVKIEIDTLVIDYDNITFVWGIEYIAQIENYIKSFSKLKNIIIVGIELDNYSLNNQLLKLLLGLNNESNIKKNIFNKNIHYLFENYNINTYNQIKLNDKTYNICYKFDTSLGNTNNICEIENLNDFNIEHCSDYTMLTE